MNEHLAGKRILVTGATGFIGGRLAERLATETSAVVTGSGRNLAAAAFIEAAGARLVRADLLDRAAMAAALEGQEVVFHVAAWLSRRHGEESAAHRYNVEATRLLVELAHAADVQRVVCVSSIAAYGPPRALVMDEATQPVDPQQPDLYGRTKAQGELEALRLGREWGLAVTVARPGMVYGPRSDAWSVSMLKLVQRGVPTLFGRADGHAFPVYIDNLIDGLLLMAARSEAVGEAFNFVDPPITWEQFFGYYGRMIGRRPRRIPYPLALGIVGVNRALRLGLPISRDRLRFYQTKTVYPTAKAERLLGYRPAVPIDEGMRRTTAWFRATGIIDN